MYLGKRKWFELLVLVLVLVLVPLTFHPDACISCATREPT
jgi:hypothetical protein